MMRIVCWGWFMDNFFKHDKNHSDQIAQYAKLETLYKTIIYLNKEVDKEQKILEKLQEADKPLVLTKEMEVK